jgi:hypothetical protein
MVPDKTQTGIYPATPLIVFRLRGGVLKCNLGSLL